MKSKGYWLFTYDTVYHDEQEQRLNISTANLEEDDSIGWRITRDGDWEIYINGKKRAVGWHNVPTDKPLWGVVEMYGKAKTIQSEFYCGELYSLRLQCVKHTILYTCAHWHMHAFMYSHMYIT